MALSFITISSLFATIYVIYIVYLVVYRLYFHPLSKYPGPLHGAVSRWPEFYYEVVQKGQFSKVIDTYHDKYGKKVIETTAPRQIC
jgi:uncharacterized membrane-anchored protein YitT (DUF2179 family)